MPQFGLSTTNSHWGYSTGAYSPYLTPSSLGSCAAPTPSQFNTPALGFSGTAPDQSSNQDAFGSSAAVSSSKYLTFLTIVVIKFLTSGISYGLHVTLRNTNF